MAGIKDYSTTQANNTTLNTISVAEGMLPSNINNAIRALMKNTRDWYNDSQWVEYGDGDGAYTATYASATSFTIAGVDVTAIYHADRRIKITATTPGTIYGTISSSTFSTDTTVNVTWDSGNLSNETIDNVYIGAISKTNNSIPTEIIATANIADGSVTNDAVTADKIADAVIVTNAEASGHTPNDTTFFTTSASDGRYFRQDSSETISSGDTWSGSDSYIATTAAIDARIIDLVDDVGGFVAIANEDSFPTTNPDINDGAGTIVSIADAGGMTYNTGTGVSTDAQTTGATTVTINSIPASIGSPIPNEYGMLVETTTTLNTYTFHRLVPIATEVTTVASVSSDITTVAGQISPTNNISTVAGISSDIQTLANIQDGTVATNAISNVGNNIGSVTTTASNIASVNNFANVYRISSSAPITSLDTGDLYFDTTVNELKVYGASGWQAAGSSVNGTSQRYNYTATNAQTTFTGADNNGNTLTYDAGYIDVYLNGVKLLNGTDVTVSSGSSVVLASGATTGDVVDIVAYGTFSVASLNADNLDSGTVPDARFPATLPAISGANLTNLDASDLASGTVPSARISGAYTGITNLTMSGDLTVDTNTLFVDASENSVGIKNTAPKVTLDVRATSFTPDNTNTSLLVEAPAVFSQAQHFYINNAGAYNSSRPTGGIGAVNSSNVITLTAGSIVTDNPGADGFKAYSTDSSLYDIGNAEHTFSTKTGLTVGNQFTHTKRVKIFNNGVTAFNDGIALGVGINNTASNVLDDYEEGTFTPQFSSSGASFTYTAAKGVYTKIGRQVCINIYFQLDGAQTLTANNVSITGLPFTSANISQLVSSLACEIRLVDLSAGATSLFGRIDANVTSIALLESGDNYASTALKSNQLSGSSCQVILSGTYPTA
jgi:hypothetical protein